MKKFDKGIRIMVMYTPEAIAALRKSLNLSVAQFAKELGVHRATIYFWESGYCHPRYKELTQLNKLAERAKKQLAS